MYYEKKDNGVNFDRNKLEIVSLESLIPSDHLVRKIEAAISFNFIHDLTRDLYSDTCGRRCIDTVVLFKIILINYLFGINSIRKTCEECKVNLAYRWFLGLGISDTIPNYSTFSQNYIRKFSDKDIFDQIFNKIITELVERDVVDTKVIFVDGTHIKANANKHKSIKKQVRIVCDKYHKELEDEVNQFRELNGRSSYPSDDDNDQGDGNITIDDKTGEVKENTPKNTELKTISTTDPECGMFNKGEHEKQFAYVDQVACDRHGWIVGFDTNPGNVHDTKAFLPFLENKLVRYNPSVICADAGYANAYNAFKVQSHNAKFLVPYVRPKNKDTEFGKKAFEYYFEIDQYRCPNHKMLIPWNIKKEGNIEYKINKCDCGNCRFKDKCLRGYAFKTITRNIFEDCMVLAKDYRLSPEGKELYALRKETIERVFAEGKERHCLRYTKYKGLKKNYNYRALLYACLNIKKLALLIFNNMKTKKLSSQYC